MYIVLECHGGAQYATVCTDENGDNLVFETEEAAQIEADNCQDGRIIEIQ